MKSNIGVKGPESLRLKNKKIEDLPLGQNNEARAGLKDFLKTHRETQKENIIAKFPKHKIEYLKASIKECELNIQKIKNFKLELKSQITEYRELIKDCNYRDQELEKLSDNNPEDKKAMKELRLKYPPYNIDAMQQQIDQFYESIDRCDNVIEQDYKSIAEIKEVLALVNQREKELSNID